MLWGHWIMAVASSMMLWTVKSRLWLLNIWRKCVMICLIMFSHCLMAKMGGIPHTFLDKPLNVNHINHISITSKRIISHINFSTHDITWYNNPVIQKTIELMVYRCRWGALLLQCLSPSQDAGGDLTGSLAKNTWDLRAVVRKISENHGNISENHGNNKDKSWEKLTINDGFIGIMEKFWKILRWRFTAFYGWENQRFVDFLSRIFPMRKSTNLEIFWLVVWNMNFIFP